MVTVVNMVNIEIVSLKYVFVGHHLRFNCQVRPFSNRICPLLIYKHRFRDDANVLLAKHRKFWGGGLLLLLLYCFRKGFEMAIGQSEGRAGEKVGLVDGFALSERGEAGRHPVTIIPFFLHHLAS